MIPQLDLPESDMRTTFFLAAALIAGGLLSNPAVAQSSRFDPAAQPPTPAEIQTFNDDLVARLKGGDLTVDFTALRMTYTDTPAYNPLGVSAAASTAISQARVAENWRLMADEGVKALRASYLDAGLHMQMAFVYGKLREAAKAEFHRGVAIGLLRSVLAVGDGKSPQTAHPVISVNEEYALLGALGLQRRSQSLIEHQGRRIDRIEVVDRDGKPSTMFFDVTKPFQAYPRALGMGSSTP